MIAALRSSIVLFLVLLALTGIAYPMFVLGVGQAVFPFQANGSLVEENGTVIGSELIGQNFTREGYFHPRPSAAGDGYDASSSAGTNLAPTSADLLKAVGDRVTALRTNSDLVPVPVDMVTASGSGLDPHISPAAARFQMGRVAQTRNMSSILIQDLINQNTVLPPLGVLGEARVNVLDLNRALDKVAPAKP